MNIRLIVSDLDGTLLDENGALPSRFASMLEKLAKRGITFAACSGRNWETLTELFAPYLSQMDFICDNGAYIVHQGIEPVFHTLPKSVWMEVVERCQTYRDDCHAILCGINGIYTAGYSHDKALFDSITRFYSDTATIVENLADVDDKIIKVSVCCPGNDSALFNKYFNAAFGDKANIQPTQPTFVDIMKLGVSKGSGVQTLQHCLGIGPQQTMAFGDYFNDVEMLQNANHAFVVANAPEEMHQYGTLAPANDQLGVISTIEKYVLQTNR